MTTERGSAINQSRRERGVYRDRRSRWRTRVLVPSGQSEASCPTRSRFFRPTSAKSAQQTMNQMEIADRQNIVLDIALRATHTDRNAKTSAYDFGLHVLELWVGLVQIPKQNVLKLLRRHGICLEVACNRTRSLLWPFLRLCRSSLSISLSLCVCVCVFVCCVCVY
jgi:hypothetical protein